MSSLNKTWFAVCMGLLMGVLIGCSSRADDSEILVFAAASLVDALTEIEREFEAQSDTSVAFSFGGSQTLAQQIASGAPADLFIAAGEFPIEFLAERELLDQDASNILANKLVVVTRSDGVRLDSMEQLVIKETVERVAIADPNLAPAGRYARESLTRLGLWDAIQKKLVIGVNARATLAYVESGNVDAALVYQTDAAIAGDVQALDIVPPESHSAIVYPAAIIKRSEHKVEAREFLEFLRGQTAKSIFIKHGFQPLEP